MGIWAPAHCGLGEIDELLVPPDKASKLLTVCLLVNSSCLSLPRESGLVKSSIHINLVDMLGCFIFYEAYFECHDIIMLGKSPMK